MRVRGLHMAQRLCKISGQAAWPGEDRNRQCLAKGRHMSETLGMSGAPMPKRKNTNQLLTRSEWLSGCQIPADLVPSCMPFAPSGILRVLRGMYGALFIVLGCILTATDRKWM